MKKSKPLSAPNGRAVGNSIAHILCSICKCEVSEDEHCNCPTCGNDMCIYCWQEESCPEHAVPYGDPYWMTVYDINHESFAKYCKREEKLKRKGLFEKYSDRLKLFAGEQKILGQEN